MRQRLAEPILNSPFEEPRLHWRIVEGETPRQMEGRRPAQYFYRDPKARADDPGRPGAGTAIELKLVNRIRNRLAAWGRTGFSGATRTTLELISWWRREGREKPLFFAQMEAALTIVFLVEAT